MKRPGNIAEYIDQHHGTFAHPILMRFSELIREGCPELDEHLKWGAPSFEHKGLMIGIAAFKKFVSLWFHQGAALNDSYNILEQSQESTKNLRKYSVSTLSEINEQAVRDLVIQAWEYNHQFGGSSLRSSRQQYCSAELEARLASDSELNSQFATFPSYKQQEFHEYLESAKRESTRSSRLEKVVLLIRKGEGLNDKYRK